MSQNDENLKPQNQNTTEVDPSIKAKNESRIVRNIPIFLEGRNETIMNVDKTGSNSTTTTTTSGHQQGHQFPSSKFINNESSKSIFSRVKDIPVRNYIPTFDQTRRSASPGARLNQQHSNIPPTKTTFQQSSSSSSSSSASSGGNKDQHQHQQQQQHEKYEEIHHNNRKQNQSYDRSQTDDKYKEQLKEYQQQRQQQYHKQQQNQDDPREDQTAKKTESFKKPIQPTNNNPITKINAILKEVTFLSEKVQTFPNGFNRNSKEYLYLDEMLTQYLLKLDTIDTEGKDDVKAFRKDVINCINKNISNLESKVSSLSLESNTTSSTCATTAVSSNANEI